MKDTQQSTAQTAPAPAEPAAPAPERTFTQAQVDAMIGERLGRERAKYADFDAIKEKADRWDAQQAANMTELQREQQKSQELQARLDKMTQAETVRGIREKVAAETGVPVDLLTGSTEEDCKTQAEKIKAYARPTYPQVRDGGDPTPPATKKATRDQFADYFNNTFFN